MPGSGAGHAPSWQCGDERNPRPSAALRLPPCTLAAIQPARPTPPLPVDLALQSANPYPAPLTQGRPLCGGDMPIIEDYDAIAKRLRELNPPATPATKDTDLTDRWRDIAADTARIYAQNRRTG